MNYNDNLILNKSIHKVLYIFLQNKYRFFGCKVHEKWKYLFKWALTIHEQNAKSFNPQKSNVENGLFLIAFNKLSL